MSATISIESIDKWIKLIDDGVGSIDKFSNKIIDPKTNKVYGLILPGTQMLAKLALIGKQLVSMEKADAATAITETQRQVMSLQGLTNVYELVHACGSVIGLGVSVAGFAAVLGKLNIIDGKLDAILQKVDVLQKSINEIKAYTEALSCARLSLAGDYLDQARHVSTEASRESYTEKARVLFAESKWYYLELWRKADPWNQVSIPIMSSLEMYRRIVACMIGEMHADYVAGDIGSLIRTTEKNLNHIENVMKLDAISVFRKYCDAICAVNIGNVSVFHKYMPTVAQEIQLAHAEHKWSLRRFRNELETALYIEESGVSLRDFTQALDTQTGDDFYVCRLSGS